MAQHLDTNLQYDVKIKHPKKYKVFLLNDDYSSMDFVIDILVTIFHNNYIEAEAITLEVHQKERAVCGVYTHEIAETKVMQVHKRARDNGFPLKATMEEE